MQHRVPLCVPSPDLVSSLGDYVNVAHGGATDATRALSHLLAVSLSPVRSRYAYTLIQVTSPAATFSAGYCLDSRENEIPYKFPGEARGKSTEPRESVRIERETMETTLQRRGFDHRVAIHRETERKFQHGLTVLSCRSRRMRIKKVSSKGV